MYIISYILLYLYITRSIKLKKKKDLLYIYWICVNIPVFEVGYCSKITHVWIVWLGLEVTGLEEEEEEETEVGVGAEAAGEEEAEGDAATKHKWQQRS